MSAKKATQPMMKTYAVFAAISGFITVALGAFGAHALRDNLSEQAIQVWQTAVLYQMFHTLTLLLISAIGLTQIARRGLVISARFFSIGIVVFSGSLYLLVLTDMRWLGAITPIGGLCLLLGWLCLAVSFFRYWEDKA